MLGRRHRPDIKLLSEYLDGRLEAAGTARLEAHVESCAACRTRLAGLRDAREALRALPAAAAPRSFRLRAAQVEAAPRVRSTPPLMRAMPVLTAAAIIVFAAVLGADLLRSSGGGSADSARTGFMPMASGDRQDYSTGEPGKSINGGAEAGAADVPGPASPGATEGSGARASADTPVPTATPPEAQAVRPEPTAAFKDSADRNANGTSGAGSDWAFRVGEVLAAAVAIAAAVTVIVWSRRRREV